MSPSAAPAPARTYLRANRTRFDAIRRRLLVDSISSSPYSTRHASRQAGTARARSAPTRRSKTRRRKEVGPESAHPTSLTRPFTRRLPCHVTLKVREGIPSLRTVPLVHDLERSFAASCERNDFRLIHYSIQGNHAHLIVEADNEARCSCSLAALKVRIAASPTSSSCESRARALGPAARPDRSRVLSESIPPPPARWFDGWVGLVGEARPAPAPRGDASKLASIGRMERRWTLEPYVITTMLARSHSPAATASSSIPQSQNRAAIIRPNAN